MQKWLEDRLEDGFHVHHIDRNSKNNEPDNLVLIDGDDHMIMHALPIRREHFRKKRKEDKRTIEAEIRAQSQQRAAEERWFALKYGYGNEVPIVPPAGQLRRFVGDPVGFAQRSSGIG
jgi:hypothetical protein